jgi:hypothetical protein
LELIIEARFATDEFASVPPDAFIAIPDKPDEYDVVYDIVYIITYHT